ncbi:MAG TPA: 1,4-dihydroxy-2-naphthoate polyprenyltransferase [Acidimicrobiia bacterium]|nr:1,4-dihydroxy-2-naphthoate polyprenyltransferase [Acidimicrobiia bacterium]
MTAASLWVQGARPRTLGAAVAPVLVGTSAAVAEADGVIWWRFGCALLVALALQVGVNYANDYSDGVRGTDEERKGPVRLTATGLAAASAVKRAAFLSFGVAAVAGLVLSLVVNPWLLLVGVAAIAAAWLYTGGPKPYGYLGLGEVMVLVFFGFVATVGSAYVQVKDVPSAAWWGSLVVGLFACAILLANNVRDVPTDAVTGKRTLAVRLGATTARRMFVACYVGSFASVVIIGISQPWALLGLLALPLAVTPVRTILTRHDPPSLVQVLVATSKLEVVVAVLVSVGLCLS